MESNQIEHLIQTMKFCANTNSCMGCDRWGCPQNTQCMERLMLEAANVLAGLDEERQMLQNQLPRWILTSERVPEEYEINIVEYPEEPVTMKISDWVLVWASSVKAAGCYRLSVARRNNGRWEFDLGPFVSDDVYCWMDMPAPPKEE